MFVSKDARASNVTCRVDELLHILSVFPDVTRVVTLQTPRPQTHRLQRNIKTNKKREGLHTVRPVSFVNLKIDL